MICKKSTDALVKAITCLGSSDTTYLITQDYKNDPFFDTALQSKFHSDNILFGQSEPFKRFVLNTKCLKKNDAVDIVCSDIDTLIINIPDLLELRQLPVVIHVTSELAGFSDLTKLKDLGIPILASSGLCMTKDFAMVSRALALTCNTLVIHYYEHIKTSEPLTEPSEHLLNALSEYIIRAPIDPEDSIIIKNSFKLKCERFQSHITDLFNILLDITGRAYSNYASYFTLNSEIIDSIVVFYGSHQLYHELIEYLESNSICLRLDVLRPSTTNIRERYLKDFPNLKTIIVVEQNSNTSKWGPIYLDVIQDFAILDHCSVKSLLFTQSSAKALDQSIKKLQNTDENSILLDASDTLGKVDHTNIANNLAIQNPYFTLLDSIFQENLFICNRDLKLRDLDASYFNPEAFVSALTKRFAAIEEYTQYISSAILNAQLDDKLKDLFSKWLSSTTDLILSRELATKIIMELEKLDSTNILFKQLKLGADYLFRKCYWMICSNDWAHDIGNGGLLALLTDELDLNLLIIETKPADAFIQSDSRKKDIGLFAMNWGNAFVASIAIHSNYTQAICGLEEAGRYHGPSIVTGFLPFFPEIESAISTIQESKRAVDSGYWPLYRFDPTRDSDALAIDSESIRRELQSFLNEQNILSQISLKVPELNIMDSQQIIRQKIKEKAKAAYNEFLDSLSGTSVTILFGSDGGQAENVAQRFAQRAKSRGLKPHLSAMDDFLFEDINKIENLIIVTSTAGQGEPPQNARAFYDNLKSAYDLDLKEVKYAVFAMGDSNYWPRKEDKHYYNKPGKDFDRLLFTLGAQRLVDIGLGDDQDADGYETGYALWESDLWVALNATTIISGEPEVKPPTNEEIKLNSDYLRGTIIQGLEDSSTGRISESDTQLTKFHGTYMQDDRDIREQRKSLGQEPAYSFMIRVRLTGGICSPKQWLQMDEISQKLGNNTFKLTTRQTFQFHGVVKSKLRPAMQAINKALLTTLGACGDVNRNVLVSSVPLSEKLHRKVYEYGKQISDRLLPHTTAYHEIWLMDSKNKKQQVSGSSVLSEKNGYNVEPLYGATYLPRKFKVNITIPPFNDVDVYAVDVGLIAISDENNDLQGFNVLIGGGMGATRNNKATYPNTAQALGFVVPEKVVDVVEKVMLVQRDYGDRKNRKHARLKYTVDDLGIDKYRREVEKLLGFTLSPERPCYIENNYDKFGWFETDGNGKEEKRNHCGIFIENGRVEGRQKEGLKKIAEILKGEFRLTANQHVYLCNVPQSQIEKIDSILKKYSMNQEKISGVRKVSAACVALPTCGLAMAESERYLPVLISKLESVLKEVGLEDDPIVIRMTGCPNGCSRPYIAEIAFVGKSLGVYDMYLGGGFYGQRLNKLYKVSVDEEQIVKTLTPMFKLYAIERLKDEKFGDFVIRKGFVHSTDRGIDFHNNVILHESEDEE